MNPRILFLCGFVSTSFVLVQSSAAAAISFTNGDFETDAATRVPNDGDFTQGAGGVPGWDDHFALGNGSGLFNPVSPVQAPSGISVLFLNIGGYVVQDLELAGGTPVTAVSESTITISGQIDNRFASPDARLLVSLRVLPNTNIMPGVLFDPVDASGYNAFTATFTLPDAATLGAFANQPLFLVFDGVGGQINLDNIAGTVVPEPSTALLAVCGLLVVSRRRRA